MAKPKNQQDDPSDAQSVVDPKVQEAELEAKNATISARDAEIKAKDDTIKAQAAQLEAQKTQLAAGPVEEPDEKAEQLYWSPAKEYRLTGFPPEKKNNAGQIVVREGAIQFREHCHTARTRAEVNYIEGADKFGVDCFRAKDLDECRMRTLARNAERTEVRSKPIETEVKEDSD